MLDLGYFKNINMIIKTTNFCVFVPQYPHIDRADGGHICIAAISSEIHTLGDLKDEELFELSILTKVTGNALIDVANRQGIEVKIINYQINGNWTYGIIGGASLHVHLYGRAISSRKQVFGQCLYLPDRKTHASFYKDNVPFNDQDVLLLRNTIFDNLQFYTQFKIDE